MAQILKNNLTINFGDKSITTSKHLDTGTTENVSLVCVKGATVTFNGNEGGVDSYTQVESFNSNDNYNVAIGVVDDGHVIINGGVYKAAYETVYVVKGIAEINGGTFFAQFDGSRKNSNNVSSYELNCHDAEYKTGEAKIIVRGGKFIGFNPADNGSEGAHTNFVAEGYESVLTGSYTFKCKDTYKRNGQPCVMPTGDGVEGWSMDEKGYITCPVWEVRPVSE